MNEENDYSLKMSVMVHIINFSLPYNGIFGGISAMTVQHMRAMNGFSNDYWGWGGIKCVCDYSREV